MVVADPIVSHASRCLTRLFCAIICRDEKASARLTASGSPSGTATASTVMAVSMYSMSLSHSTSRKSQQPSSPQPRKEGRTMPSATIARKQNTAAARPTLKTSSTMPLSLTNRGDASSSSSSSWYTAILILPETEYGPTATTSIRPEPLTTSVPETQKGASAVFGIGSGSPVREDSSTLTSEPERRTPSHGSEARLCALKASTSPTTISASVTSVCSPRRTTTFLLDWFSFAARDLNCRSLT
mmetsp:Transcript_47422/g.153926  ORF Transcript_47422/g.153926 Transcript_47422/m.153926 type:complete len:242 (-) Transcript_47422:497-1222(-)